MPALQREAAWAIERLLGDLRQSVPQNGCVHWHIIVAIASASYRIEKPQIPENWKRKRQKKKRKFLCFAYFSPIFPLFLLFFAFFSSYFLEFGAFLFCSWPTRYIIDFLFFFDLHREPFFNLFGISGPKGPE